MVRATSAPSRRKRKKQLLKHAKGFRWSRKNKYRLAKEHLLKAWRYSYRDRKTRKREKRKLWQVQINAAIKALGFRYSNFIYLLKKKDIELNRKVLAELAKEKPDIFKEIVRQAKS